MCFSERRIEKRLFHHTLAFVEISAHNEGANIFSPTSELLGLSRADRDALISSGAIWP